uniref:TraL conjugative transposon family protein n=1 Tax=Prevotella sp. GTC17254 TaxID=3236794 RepID=A0AB33J4X2_9BACT
MKKKSLLRIMRENAERKLRRLCGRIPMGMRIAVIMGMFLVFAACSVYVFCRGIFSIFCGDAGCGEGVRIEHLEVPDLRLKRQNDSIKSLKNHDYAQFHKKKEFRQVTGTD